MHREAIQVTTFVNPTCHCKPLPKLARAFFRMQFFSHWQLCNLQAILSEKHPVDPKVSSTIDLNLTCTSHLALGYATTSTRLGMCLFKLLSFRTCTLPQQPHFFRLLSMCWLGEVHTSELAFSRFTPVKHWICRPALIDFNHNAKDASAKLSYAGHLIYQADRLIFVKPTAANCS